MAAVLIKKEGALIRQEQTTRLILKSISLEPEFRAFYCGSSSSNPSKKACLVDVSKNLLFFMMIL